MEIWFFDTQNTFYLIVRGLTTEWRDQKFHPRPIPRLFLRLNIFETDTETFSRPIPRLVFETKWFRDRYWHFFSRHNFSRPIPILFSTNFFKTETETYFETKFFETATLFQSQIFETNPEAFVSKYYIRFRLWRTFFTHVDISLEVVTWVCQSSMYFSPFAKQVS